MTGNARFIGFGCGGKLGGGGGFVKNKKTQTKILKPRLG